MAVKGFACSWCGGSGKVKIPCPAKHHAHIVTVPCGRCGGTGDERCNVRSALEDRGTTTGVSCGKK